jgi:hypothetical protein
MGGGPDAGGPPFLARLGPANSERSIKRAAASPNAIAAVGTSHDGNECSTRATTPREKPSHRCSPTHIPNTAARTTSIAPATNTKALIRDQRSTNAVAKSALHAQPLPLLEIRAQIGAFGPSPLTTSHEDRRSVGGGMERLVPCAPCTHLGAGGRRITTAIAPSRRSNVANAPASHWAAIGTKERLKLKIRARFSTRKSQTGRDPLPLFLKVGGALKMAVGARAEAALWQKEAQRSSVRGANSNSC